MQRRRLLIGLAAVAPLVVAVLGAYYWFVVRGPEPRIQVRDGNEQTVLIIGDSYVAGSVSNGGPEWPEQLHDEYGWTVITNAVGGVGYLRISPDVPDDGPFSTQATELLDRFDPDVVVLEGGLNDTIYPAAEVDAAMRDLVADLAEGWPDAEFVLLSPFAPTHALYSADHVAVAAAVAEEAGFRYVDVSRWFLDGPDEWIGKDGLHPSDERHEMIADELGPVIEEELAR